MALDFLNATHVKQEGLFTKQMERVNHEVWAKVLLDDGPSVVYAVDKKKEVKGTIACIRDKKEKNTAKHTWVDVSYSIQPSGCECNEFFNEAAICYLVKTHLADVPCFSRAAIQGIFPSKFGMCEMQFTAVKGIDLEDCLNSIPVEYIHSVIAQVLVSIRLGQQRIQLKHHDFHLKNILVEPRETPGQWIVDTPEGSLCVPLLMDATIIDFGLSSATDPTTGKRFKRIDECLLIQQDDDDSSSNGSWGVWGSELQGDEGYDMAMLVECLTEELFTKRPLEISKIALVASLQPLVNVNFTSRGRPRENCSIDWSQVWKILHLHG